MLIRLFHELFIIYYDLFTTKFLEISVVIYPGSIFIMNLETSAKKLVN